MPSEEEKARKRVEWFNSLNQHDAYNAAANFGFGVAAGAGAAGPADTEPTDRDTDERIKRMDKANREQRVQGLSPRAAIAREAQHQASPYYNEKERAQNAIRTATQAKRVRLKDPTAKLDKHERKAAEAFAVRMYEREVAGFAEKIGTDKNTAGKKKGTKRTEGKKTGGFKRNKRSTRRRTKRRKTKRRQTRRRVRGKRIKR